MPVRTFADLPELVQHLGTELENKKFALLYAYNGTGKTRLSLAFEDLGGQNGDVRDTLYFNAFTEDGRSQIKPRANRQTVWHAAGH